MSHIHDTCSVPQILFKANALQDIHMLTCFASTWANFRVAQAELVLKQDSATQILIERALERHGFIVESRFSGCRFVFAR